ncbi:Aspartate aminotransferase, chloroplastic [Linum perenne]
MYEDGGIVCAKVQINPLKHMAMSDDVVVSSSSSVIIIPSQQSAAISADEGKVRLGSGNVSSLFNNDKRNPVLHSKSSGRITMSLDVDVSRFEAITMAPPDPILGVSEAFKADNDQKKLNLGVGAYRTEELQPYVLDVVKKAENLMLEKGDNKEVFKFMEMYVHDKEAVGFRKALKSTTTGLLRGENISCVTKFACFGRSTRIFKCPSEHMAIPDDVVVSSSSSVIIIPSQQSTTISVEEVSFNRMCDHSNQMVPSTLQTFTIDKHTYFAYGRDGCKNLLQAFYFLMDEEKLTYLEIAYRKPKPISQIQRRMKSYYCNYALLWLPDVDNDVILNKILYKEGETTHNYKPHELDFLHLCRDFSEHRHERASDVNVTMDRLYEMWPALFDRLHGCIREASQAMYLKHKICLRIRIRRYNILGIVNFVIIRKLVFVLSRFSLVLLMMIDDAWIVVGKIILSASILEYQVSYLVHRGLLCNCQLQPFYRFSAAETDLFILGRLSFCKDVLIPILAIMVLNPNVGRSFLEFGMNN